MGTADFQGKIWGSRANDWANYGESTSMDLFNAVLSQVKFNGKTNLLDIGCGSGTFCRLAASRGASVTGIDASENLISIARRRVPDGNFHRGDMEELPYGDSSFDIITGFNSIQFAGSIEGALREARRVAKKEASAIVVFWSRPELCDATVVFSALAQYMPAPPPAAVPDRKPLYTPGVFEDFAERAGFTVIKSEDIECIWEFDSQETGVRAMLSAGMIAKAIEREGEKTIRETVTKAIQPFRRNSGSFRFRNTFRLVKLVK